MVLISLVGTCGAAATRRDYEPSPAAREIVQELNLVRQDPPGYAMKLEELLPLYRGNERRLGPHEFLSTQEGAPAVEEAIRVLKATKPRRSLELDACLCHSAADHVADSGPRGAFGHNGSRGETFADRIRRYRKRYHMLGENIDYGSSGAGEVVISLLIDDGVPGRGHRKNILEPAFDAAGAACGAHAQMRTICVIDFAKD